MGKEPGTEAVGGDHVPILFRTKQRQQMFVAMAYLGPLRVYDAVALSGGSFPQAVVFRNFLKTGLVIRYGTRRCRCLALKNDFPGAPELTTLLRAFEFKVDAGVRPVPPPSLEQLPSIESYPTKAGEYEFFGTRPQTLAIMTVSLRSGVAKDSIVQTVLTQDGAGGGNAFKTIESLIARGLLRRNGDNLELSPSLPVAELVSFVENFVDADERAKLSPVSQIRPHKELPRNHVWRGPITTDVERPRGHGASGDLTPLLFDTVAKIRTMIAVAVNGPMKATHIVRHCKISRGSFEIYVKDGLLVQYRPVKIDEPGRWFGLNPDIPAFTELVTLLTRLEHRFRTPRVEHRVSLSSEPLHRAEWAAANRNYFGSVARTDILLSLAAAGEADSMTIHRGNSDHDVHTVESTLRMFRIYGIVRHVKNEGNAEVHDLDPDWFAAEELHALLSALIHDRQYLLARASMAMDQMPPMRQASAKRPREPVSAMTYRKKRPPKR